MADSISTNTTQVPLPKERRLLSPVKEKNRNEAVTRETVKRVSSHPHLLGSLEEQVDDTNSSL